MCGTIDSDNYLNINAKTLAIELDRAQTPSYQPSDWNCESETWVTNE